MNSFRVSKGNIQKKTKGPSDKRSAAEESVEEDGSDGDDDEGNNEGEADGQNYEDTEETKKVLKFLLSSLTTDSL
jgi:hypothetical protein